MTLGVVWSRLARARLEEIRAYVEFDNPKAAGSLAARIVEATESLRSHPRLGRAGAKGTRQLIIAGEPYIIIYRVLAKQIFIHTIWHAAQDNKL